MMIQIAGMARPVRFEDSGLEPLAVGKFLSGAMERGHMSAKSVVIRTGIPAEQLQGILGDQIPVDRKAAKKLERVFPKLGPVLLRMQAERRFFEKYGAVRPASPLRRANLIRSKRAALRAA